MGWARYRSSQKRKNNFSKLFPFRLVIYSNWQQLEKESEISSSFLFRFSVVNGEIDNFNFGAIVDETVISQLLYKLPNTHFNQFINDGREKVLVKYKFILLCRCRVAEILFSFWLQIWFDSYLALNFCVSRYYEMVIVGNWLYVPS